MMASRKIGLVVGCAQYKSSDIESLKYADADAQDVYDRLIHPEIGGYEPNDVTLLLSPDFGTLNLAILRQLRAAQPNDSFLLYFAGHGLRDETGQMFLAGADTEPELLEASAVPAQFVRNHLDRCRSKQICVILDCCFSGSFGGQSRGGLDRVAVQEGVSKLSGAGTVVLTSAQSSQHARERDEFKHGVFTHYLLRGLDGEADHDNDGLITPDELFRFVAHRMDADVGPTQRPTILANYAGGSFALVQSRKRRLTMLDELHQRVEGLCASRKHQTALQELDRLQPQSTTESRSVDDLRTKVHTDMERLRGEFEARIVEDARSGRTGHKLALEILQLVRDDADFLFSDRPTDGYRRLIRHYLLELVRPEAMQELWEDIGRNPAPTQPTVQQRLRTNEDATAPAGTAEPQSAPADATFSKGIHEAPRATRPFRPSMQVLAWSGLLTATLLGAWLIRDRFSATPMNAGALRVGILLKPEWQDETDVVRRAFTTMFASLNSRFSKANEPYGFTPSVQTFGNVKAVISAFERGAIDLAGELSPRDIHESNQASGTVPFISAEYSGSQTYSALFFTSSNYINLDKSEVGELKPNTWNNILSDLINGEKLLVTSDQSSTSGYWYPRRQMIAELTRLRSTRGFDDVSDQPEESEDVATLVACLRRNVIVGVTAAYRLQAGATLDREYLCGPSTAARLVPVSRSEAIPQGAFVVRRELAADASFMSRLTGNWQGAMTDAFSRAEFQHLNLPSAWTVVSLTTYAGAYETFEIPDPVGERQYRDQRRIVVVSAVIALAASLLYIWIKTRPRELSEGRSTQAP
jgi:ABC-type phosphate/phosphonate transport system substrate-binding protein